MGMTLGVIGSCNKARKKQKALRESEEMMSMYVH